MCRLWEVGRCRRRWPPSREAGIAGRGHPQHPEGCSERRVMASRGSSELPPEPFDMPGQGVQRLQPCGTIEEGGQQIR